jgi:hypothetical protein
VSPPERQAGDIVGSRLQNDAQNVAAPPHRPDGEEQARSVLEHAQAIRQFDGADQFKPSAGLRAVMKSALGQEAVLIVDDLAGTQPRPRSRLRSLFGEAAAWPKHPVRERGLFLIDLIAHPAERRARPIQRVVERIESVRSSPSGPKSILTALNKADVGCEPVCIFTRAKLRGAFKLSFRLLRFQNFVRRRVNTI